jgi:hypothetical protein
MVDHNQRMERTLCLWEVSIALYQRILFVKCCVFYATVCFVQILFFQTSWLSMTWKIKSLGGLTTTVSASTLKPALSKNLSSSFGEPWVQHTYNLYSPNPSSAITYLLPFIFISFLWLKTILSFWNKEREKRKSHGCLVQTLRVLSSKNTTLMGCLYFPPVHLLVISGSSSIKVKDDKTGATYTVNSHDISSSGWRFRWNKTLVLLLVIVVSSYLIC